jgi:hypothetical protein
LFGEYGWEQTGRSGRQRRRGMWVNEKLEHSVPVLVLRTLIRIAVIPATVVCCLRTGQNPCRRTRQPCLISRHLEGLGMRSLLFFCAILPVSDDAHPIEKLPPFGRRIPELKAVCWAVWGRRMRYWHKFC